MKFAKYLESESIPEWRKAYINYKGLKKRLKAIEKVNMVVVVCIKCTAILTTSVKIVP